MADLAIKDLAERTGIAPGTIRMWEQRYGFPVPERTAAGYRRYTEHDADALKRVTSFRKQGLSIPAAIERARPAKGMSDRPSIFAAVARTDHGARPRVLRKRTLVAISRAIEHETLAHAAKPVVFGAFQHEPAYRAVEHRYRALTKHADAAVVFADFQETRVPDDGPAELAIGDNAKLGNEWSLIVDAPGLASCLVAWEHPSGIEPGGDRDLDRRFEAVWTIDPAATRLAADTAAALAADIDEGCGARLKALLEDRPLAREAPAPALTALTNRMVAYLEPVEAV